METDETRTTWRTHLQSVVLIVGTIGNIIFGYLNLTSREATNAQMEAMRKEVQMQRTMLNSRATVQMTAFNALKRANLLTPQEIEEVYKLWVPAEYDIDKRPAK